MHPVPGRMRTLCAEKNRREKVGFRDTFRKRENTHMETAPYYLCATDFFARKIAAKIA